MDPDLDSAPEDAVVEPTKARPPLYRRIPWKRLLAIVFVLAFWMTIGLVCTPAYWRF